MLATLFIINISLSVILFSFLIYAIIVDNVNQFSHTLLAQSSRQLNSQGIIQDNIFIDSNQPMIGSQQDKIVILSFDDHWKSQYTIAKSILDKFGFKATFFVACSDVGKNMDGERMSWKEIVQLQSEGQDIQSHSMTHEHLNNMSLEGVTYEVSQSKQCLLDHGINSTIFAYPFNEGSHNSTIVNEVSKVYSLARSGDEPLIFLQCNGWKFISSQKDCRPFFNNGTLTFVNRYSLPGWTHKSDSYPLNSSEMFKRFTEIINSQSNYNRNEINALPVLVYHDLIFENITEYKHDTFTIDKSLFHKEIEYLYNNNFRILTMNDLGYNECTNQLYIKDQISKQTLKCNN